MKKVTFVLLLVSLLLLGLNDSGLSEGFEGFDIELIPQEGESADPDHEGLEVRLGTWAIYDSWNGIQEESNVWAVLDVTIQNWTINTLNIQDSLSAVLIYHESFEYPATLMFSLNNLGMIERLDGQLGFMVPEIVALAQPDELSLTIRSLDKEIKVESANLVYGSPIFPTTSVLSLYALNISPTSVVVVVFPLVPVMAAIRPLLK